MGPASVNRVRRNTCGGSLFFNGRTQRSRPVAGSPLKNARTSPLGENELTPPRASNGSGPVLPSAGTQKDVRLPSMTEVNTTRFAIWCPCRLHVIPARGQLRESATLQILNPEVIVGIG